MWHSPLLTFPNVDLEGSYRRYYLGKVETCDKITCAVSSACFMMNTAELLGRTGIFTAVGWLGVDWNVLCQSCLVFLLCLWVYSIPREIYLRWRSVVVFCLRVLQVVFLIFGTVHDDEPDSLSETMLSSLLSCMRSTGTLSSFSMALGFPLMIKQHIWVHTLAMLLPMKISFSRKFCVHMLWPEQCLADQGLGPAGHGPWGLSGEPLSVPSWLSMMTTWMTRALRLICDTGLPSTTTQRSLQSTCTGNHLLLQLALGWWLPTGLLFFGERSSRRQFLLYVVSDHEETRRTARLYWEVEQSMSLATRLRYYASHLITLAQSPWALVLMWQLLLCFI